MSIEKEKGRAGTPYDDDNPSGYWRRKQSPNINRVMGDADLPLAPPDEDCETRNYPGYKGEGPKDPSRVKSSTIWDDEAWKDKD